ncbi:MAG: diguanylate cyclase (GGDEF)-like protein [Paraglaciecola sp.]|jgi:diguanylate cyclase (GGDEF)-like protein
MIASDITQIKFLLQNNEHLTQFDVLTDLPNRQFFWQQLEHLVLKDQPFFWLYLDIKHFKRINEIHGHLVGDQIIRDLACRIKQLLKGDDVLARVGGTEFAIPQHGNEQSQCIEYADDSSSVTSCIHPIRAQM